MILIKGAYLTKQSFQNSESGNMMYNPKITPLTINVGPAATYEQPGCQSNQPLRVAPQVSQQHLIERRNNCNKSCLVTLILFICKYTQDKYFEFYESSAYFFSNHYHMLVSDGRLVFGSIWSWSWVWQPCWGEAWWLFSEMSKFLLDVQWKMWWKHC